MLSSGHAGLSAAEANNPVTQSQRKRNLEIATALGRSRTFASAQEMSRSGRELPARERQLSPPPNSNPDIPLPAICAHHHLGFELQNPAAFQLEPRKAGCRVRPGMMDRAMAHLPR